LGTREVHQLFEREAFVENFSKVATQKSTLPENELSTSILEGGKPYKSLGESGNVAKIDASGTVTIQKYLLLFESKCTHRKSNGRCKEAGTDDPPSTFVQKHRFRASRAGLLQQAGCGL
jgi:hypothetical protein